MTQVAIYTGEEEKFEAERQRLLATYDASEKLAKWTARDRSGKSVIIQYYPANWRLYELRLRYPNVTIETEIVTMDIERDFVIVRAWIFTGLTYAESYGPGHKRASGMKQGKLTILDKVETGAKARAARDFGIGTEHALDMDDGEIEASITMIEDQRLQSNGVVESTETTIAQLKALCDEVLGTGKWGALRGRVLNPEEIGDVPDDMLSVAQKARIHGALVAHQRQKQAKAKAS